MLRRLSLVLGAFVLLVCGCGRIHALPPASNKAIAAADGLQSAFYTGNGMWNGAGYWDRAEALGVILDAYQLTHQQKWLTVIQQVYVANQQDHTPGDYISSYMDDEQWWALDWVRAWDLTGNISYLNSAKAVFTNVTENWGDGCGGGVWWNDSHTYKNAIPNELFLLLATQLYERTPGGTTYLSWAKEEANWFIQSGMINSEGLVNDGLTSSCTNNNGTTWTYNQGVILAGMTQLYQLTGDKLYLTTAETIANAAIQHLVGPGDVLYEPCEATNHCDSDQYQFKGIFIRYLWWMYNVDPNPTYKTFLETNLNAIWTKDRTTGNLFGLFWDGPAPVPVSVTVGEDTAAAAALTSTAIVLPSKPRIGPAASSSQGR